MSNNQDIFVDTDRCATENIGANEPVNAIALSCLYSKGRGIYLHASKVHRANGMWSTVFWGDAWIHGHVLLEQMTRGNAKKFQRYEQAVRDNAQEIADAFIDRDTDRMRSIVLQAL